MAYKLRVASWRNKKRKAQPSAAPPPAIRAARGKRKKGMVDKYRRKRSSCAKTTWQISLPERLTTIREECKLQLTLSQPLAYETYSESLLWRGEPQIFCNI